MACQIKRGKNGELLQVLAANGGESLAYKALLDAVNGTKNTEHLQEKFKSWEGKHINTISDNKELALALYKQMYSPAFKSWFGDWERSKENSSKVMDENGEPLVVYHGSTYADFEKFNKGKNGIWFTSDKVGAQMYQINQSIPEPQEGAGVFPVFLNSKTPLIKNYSHTNNFFEVNSDASGLAKTSHDGLIGYNVEEDVGRQDTYVVFDPTQIKSVFNQGTFGLNNNIYQQKTDSITPSKASPETLKKIKEFLSRIGVEVKSLNDLQVNGRKITANGLADPLNGLIQVANGKEDIALTEEAMHIAVELIAQKNSTLFRQLMNGIGRYAVLNQVIQDYKGIKEYQTEDGKPNIPKLKKEAIGKVLAQTVINKNEGVNEKPELLVQTSTWWQKIIDWLKGFFGKAAMNPFEIATEKVLSGEDLGNVSELTEDSGIFLQTTRELSDKLENNNNNVAKIGDKYEVNGTPIRNTVMDDVKELFRRKDRNKVVGAVTKAAREYKEETENKTKQDLKDILGRYIDDTGFRRVTETPHVNPSAINPYNNEFYNTLEAHIKERLDTYPTGTQFFKSVNLYDNKTSTAGTADLIALLPDGKIDLLQFKVPDIGIQATDIGRDRQEAYNIEIEALRKVLENGYGVRRDQFRLTRAIPIRAAYEYAVPGDPDSGLKLKEMKIGTTKVELIKDDILLPVPSTSESSGNEKFDKFVSRLRGLVQKLASERVTPDKRFEKSQRIAALLASIRKLQVQRNAKGVLNSGAAIVKAQQEKYQRLQNVIKNLDAAKATTDQLNKIASQILDEKDQIELYSQLYSAFKNVFTDGSNESKEYLKQAREISDDAQDALDNYWQMAVDFRKYQFAKNLNITDEFRPEKQLTWYRKMVRSLSQSSIKAGEFLWGLVNNINNRFQLEFQDRLKEVDNLKEEVDKWMVGKTLKDLYSKILALNKNGSWNGAFIRQYSKDFYTKLAEAQEKGDLKWALNNIDRKAYEGWYFAEHQRRIDDSKTARYHPDDAENKKIILNQLQTFVDTFFIGGKKGINKNNYKLREFPKQGLWESTEYKELLKSDNAPVLKLYNHWRERLRESFELGMIDEHNGWSWFPNVRRNLIEKMFVNKAGGKIADLFSDIRIEPEDPSFGKIDPLTGKSIDEVHANFVSDLGNWVKDVNGDYFLDYQNKSMDLFKVMALWDREILKYRLKTDSEDLARLIHYTETGQNQELQKGAYKTTRTGNIQRDKEGNPIIVDNEINARYIKEHIDAVWYSKALSDESDFSIPIPYKKIVTGINKLFGKEVLQVPDKEVIEISGVKGLQAMNRFFVTKTLGINVFTAAANMFGGTVNSYINQGKFFDKADLLQSEIEYTSGRFWASEENKKMAGLLSYLHPYLEDKTTEEIRDLSVSKMVRYLSSDHLFYLQRGSDNFVNRIIAMSFIKNTMVKDGKIVNIRAYAKKELGYQDKYAGTYEQAKEFTKKLDARVEELKKSPDALLNVVQIVNDKIIIPGIDRLSPTVVGFRQSMVEFIKDALGNTSREDLSLYKRSVMWQSFFMFKNWIPRMLDVRGQSLKYSPGSQQYEWGRIRMLGRAVQHLGLSTVSSLLKQLGGNDKNIVEVAKKLYKEKQEYAVEQEQEFTMNEAEFVDMYIKGVRSEFKELALALGLMALLIAARHASPDKDEDPKIKGGYKWMLRALDKLQDEVSFFYNPKSFTDIVNGSVFPSVGMLVDVQKFLTTAFAKMFYTVIGDEQKAGSEKVSKYLFKVLPVTKELMQYIALFNADIAKEYGIKISSQNGSSR